MVYRSFLKQQLGNNARFPGISVKIGRTLRVDPDFGRAVAPEHGTVLNDAGTRSGSRRRNSRAYAGQTAPAHDDVIAFA
jgi:hypothetical protein